MALPIIDKEALFVRDYEDLSVDAALSARRRRPSLYPVTASRAIVSEWAQGDAIHLCCSIQEFNTRDVRKTLGQMVSTVPLDRPFGP